MKNYDARIYRLRRNEMPDGFGERISYHPYRIQTSGTEFDYSRSADDRADALERIAQSFLARC